MNSKLLFSLILVIIFSISVVENKTFLKNLQPREVETDCGKLSDPKAPKCCPTTCRRCNNGLDKKKRSVCHWLKVGKNGRREKCCTFFTVCKQNKKKITTCYNTKRVCKWTSKLVKTYKKSNCYWQRRAGGKQRKCCRWTVKCFGKKCFDLRKKCLWRGKIVTVSNDHGCRWVTIGKNIRRQKCCKQIRKCVGDKCTVRNTKNCRWNSLPIKHDWITRCKWNKKKSTNTKTCCSYFKRCVGKKCVIRKNECRVTDKTTIKRRKACYWRRYKKGRRQRCCSFSTFCRKKQCRKLFRKCKWVGKTIWWTSVQKCKWQKKTKNTRQKRCCKYIKKCVGSKCQTKKTLCDWRGHPIYSKLIKNCRWVADHKEGSKRYCCKRFKFCTKKKGCKILHKKCGFTGLSIQWKTKTHCKWAKFKDYKQRRCCYRRIRCKNHKNCRVFRESCKYIGPKVTSQKKQVCKFLKEGKGRRKRCCSFVRYCYGKRCKDINRRCKTGKRITYKNNAKCFFEGVVKGWRRKVCCAYARKCLNNKCSLIRRMCKVTEVRKRTKEGIKIIELKKKKFENDKKFRITQVNKACDCYNQENQNLKVATERRTSTSTKFQECKKRESDIKILLNKTTAKVQQAKLKVQLKRRGRKCKKLFRKLTKIGKKLAKYKDYVAKKKVECESKRTAYAQWLVTVRYERKKYRSFERSQERLERATLVKKYENREEFYKFKVEQRQVNIQKDVKKLSAECRKTQVDLQKIKKIATTVDRRFLRVETRCKNLQKGLKKQKRLFRKSRMIAGKQPRNKLRRRFFLRQKLRTQKVDSNYLKCKKQLEKVRVQKKKSDENYKTAISNNNNCKNQIRKEKTVAIRVQKREVKVQKDLKKLLHPKPAPKKVTPPPRPPAQARVVRRPNPPMRRRRGARGDVWLQDRKGNWVDVNVIGTFVYLKDNKNKFEIDAQFGHVGLGSVISAVLVRARGNEIKAEKNGQVTLNGRLVKETSAVFEFNGRNVVVKKLKTKRPGLFQIQGLTRERFTFRYFKNLKSYDLEASTADKTATGLFSDPVNPKKYILKQPNSKFNRYISFSVNDESDGNEDQKKEAAKCCAKLKGKSRARCQQDYYRTDVCFAEEHAAKLPLRKNKKASKSRKVNRK